MLQIGIFILSLLSNAQQNLRFYQFFSLKRGKNCCRESELKEMVGY